MDWDKRVDEMIAEGVNKNWKTPSSFFSWLRGGIRKIWNTHPTKLEVLKEKKKAVANPKYVEGGRYKPTVMGYCCEICNRDVVAKEAQVDHKKGGKYSLKNTDDISVFIKNILLVLKEDLRVVCKECHDIQSYAEKNGISLALAKAKKEVIKMHKEKTLDCFLQENGLEFSGSIPKKKLFIQEILERKYNGKENLA